MSPQQTPRWQELAGLTPEAELQMSPEQLDIAVAKLLAEAERIARAEFDRAARVPAGLRTVFWDPLEAICQDLEISRTKLSRYLRRVTGMRASDIVDRIKGAALPDALEREILDQIEALWKTYARRLIRVNIRNIRPHVQKFLKLLRESRGQDRGQAMALKLGFQNLHRLKRGLLLAHGVTLESIEHRVVSKELKKRLLTWASKHQPIARDFFSDLPLDTKFEAAKPAKKEPEPKPQPAKKSEPQPEPAQPLHPVVADVLDQMAYEIANKKRKSA